MGVEGEEDDSGDEGPPPPMDDVRRQIHKALPVHARRVSDSSEHVQARILAVGAQARRACDHGWPCTQEAGASSAGCYDEKLC